MERDRDREAHPHAILGRALRTGIFHCQEGTADDAEGCACWFQQDGGKKEKSSQRLHRFSLHNKHPGRASMPYLTTTVIYGTKARIHTERHSCVVVTKQEIKFNQNNTLISWKRAPSFELEINGGGGGCSFAHKFHPVPVQTWVFITRIHSPGSNRGAT